MPLNIVALACASQKLAVTRAAGIEPLLSPPLTLATFDPGVLTALTPFPPLPVCGERGNNSGEPLQSGEGPSPTRPVLWERGPGGEGPSPPRPGCRERGPGGEGLLYLALHGMPGQPYLYGDDLVTALHVDAFRDLDLSACVVFASSCHFPDTPFLKALLHCRPRMLVAGHGQNYARNTSLVGVHRLGYYLRQGLQAGIPPGLAFAAARQRLRYHLHTLKTRRPRADPRRAEDIAATEDTLAFEAWIRA